MPERSADALVADVRKEAGQQPFRIDTVAFATRLETGRKLHRQGNLSAAIQHYHDVLTHAPQTAAAWHLCGVALLQQGELPAALELLSRAVALEPANPGYHRNLGEAHQTAGNWSQSILSLEQSLRLDPLHPGTWTTMSEVLLQIGEVSPSLDCLSQALQLDPNFLLARLLLANTQQQLGEDAAAIANYRFVLAQQPENTVAAVNLAAILRRQGESHQALELLRSVVQREPGSPLIAYNLANTLVDLGEFAEARQHYQAALPGHPRPAKVLLNLVSITRCTAETRPQISGWEQIARTRLSTDEDRAQLHFALGKAHDDCGEYDAAFMHYQQGNNFAGVHFDPPAHRQHIQRLNACWTAEFVQARQQWGIDDPRPVFIVGMPRSGTTLIEQILAGHSRVNALGERTRLGELVHSHAASLGCGDDEALAAQRSTQADLYVMARDYLQGTPPAGPDMRLTDKMPTNFLLLGWLAVCFPQATIIHCQRDPRDVCLSCYFQHFTERLPFTYDLQHLAEYYRDYERLMRHWQAVLPGRILNVRYEELVCSPEAQARRMVDHCGLEWESSCLQSYAVDRAVKTASGWQVRQPIYTTSQARWRNYRQHLAPLLEEFGDLPQAQ